MRRVNSSKDQIAATARDTFGLQTLRPGQQEAIDSVLVGHETIAVFPTRLPPLGELDAKSPPGVTLSVRSAPVLLSTSLSLAKSFPPLPAPLRTLRPLSLRNPLPPSPPDGH